MYGRFVVVTKGGREYVTPPAEVSEEEYLEFMEFVKTIFQGDGRGQFTISDPRTDLPISVLNMQDVSSFTWKEE